MSGKGFGRSTASFTIVAGLIAAAVGLAPATGAQARELRIGFIAPMTGPFAQVGTDMANGFRMYLGRAHYKFAGDTVKFFIGDSEGKPSVAVLKAEQLIRQDKVQMFVGGLLASTGYALAPVSTREKTVYILSIPASDNLTQRELGKYPYIIRTGWSSSQPSHPFGQWACEQGYKKIDAIGADYAFGYEVIGGFQQSFEDCGGKIIQKLWPPLGTIDFGPYIPQLKSGADAIFTLMVGPMSLEFPRQLADSGNKKPVLGGGTSYDEFVLPSMGNWAIGAVSALQYSAAIPTAKNEAFVKAYRAAYGKVPSYYSESNYTTAELVNDVMKETHGKWPGAKEFIAKMAALKINAVRGPVSFDKFRNPVQNIYIRKVEKKKMFGYPKAELWNAVIKTYPHVSQFWHYNVKKYLKQPVYTRSFPPCRYCN